VPRDEGEGADPHRGPGFGARLRRLRRTAGLRETLAETDLAARHLMLPLFVARGEGPPEPIPSMDGVNRYPAAALADLARELREVGIGSVLLFGTVARKDPEGRGADAADSAVAEAIRALRAASPELVIATDVCLCAYTTHGHCGVVAPDGSVDNEATLERLARVAVAHATAGADLVAPSAMMDGQVERIRRALDGAGRDSTGILAYSTKHASAFYGPFRDAEGSAPSFGDRRGYQMDPRNGREAMRELLADAEEGADILMVKPALTSLDLLARARARVDLPLAAFQVSGEHAMLKSAAARGAIDERSAVLETLMAIRRAGADLVVTYFAVDAARWIRGSGP
jgi:porphobilinogen synthase